MLIRPLFSLFLSLILSIVISNVSGKIVKRMVGGLEAPPGRFLHQVSLQYLTPYGCAYHHCGGSILDEKHIITAAHCVTDLTTHKLDNVPIFVVAGTTDLRVKSSGIYRDIEYTFIPNSYTKNHPKFYFDDIAILRLTHPLPLKDQHQRIRAVNLPAANQYLSGYTNTQYATMSGFGTYQQTVNPYSGKITKGGSSPVLKYTFGRINTLLPGYEHLCGANQVCVTPWNPNKEGEDGGICQGDSGGPLVDESTNTLIGVVSSTLEECGQLSMFARVSSYLDFIKVATKGGFAKKIDNAIFFYESLN
ncbi:hypothetical protein TKK_0017508 [Trichogramma kaykai]